VSTAQGITLVVLLLTLFLPGLAVGAAAGLRGWLLAATAPLLTYGVISIAAPVLPAVFGRWTAWGFAVAVAVVCAVLYGVRFVVRRRWGTDDDAPRWLGRPVDAAPLVTWSPVQHAGVAAVLACTAALGLFVVSRATDQFTAVHQFWDAIFHANATRYIADTGLSAPVDLYVIRPDNPVNFFYPNTFHVQLATVLMIDSGPVVDLLNLRAGITAGVFALSMVALVRRVVGRPALAVAVAVVCGAFSTFPYDLAYFGPIWPFSAALSLLPAFLALFVEMVERPRPEIVLVGSLGMLGLAAAHLSIGLAAAVFGVAFLVQRWWVLRRVPARDIAVLAVPGVVGCVMVLPVALTASEVAGGQAVDWPIINTPGGALGTLLFLNHDTAYPQWWLVFPLLLGLAAVRLLKPIGWWLAGGAVFTVLFTLAASYEGRLVALLTDPWWNDRWRFLALVAPTLILLAGNGLVFARDQLLRLPRVPGSFVVRAVALTGVMAALVVLSHGLYYGHNAQRISNAYTDGPTLSRQEQAALDELATLVPGGTLVMNDSNDGSAWMWALHDLRPVYGHAIPPGAVESLVDSDRALLYERFDELDTDEDVRAAVRRLDIGFVFIGDGFASPTSSRAPGLEDLDDVADLELVYSNDQARIYRLGDDLRSGS
jgi:hypothetical protein